MDKYSLNIDFADNGCLCVLKCDKCSKKWVRVFENPSKDIIEGSFLSWRKPLMDEHNLSHKR